MGQRFKLHLHLGIWTLSIFCLSTVQILTYKVRKSIWWECGGANLTLPGGRYGTALQAASVSGHLDVVEVLLKYGTNVNIQGEEYITNYRRRNNPFKQVENLIQHSKLHQYLDNWTLLKFSLNMVLMLIFRVRIQVCIREYMY